jgi:glycosyltransferase involved in cell wall biosynthesis
MGAFGEIYAGDNSKTSLKNRYNIEMKLVAILRIKNEILVIREFLERLSKLVDEIVVVDNGSTDGTKEVYKDFSKIASVINTEGFDEGRDKTILLDKAKERKADWIIWLDGDELFEDFVTRDMLLKYMKSGYERIAFRLSHFWLSKKKCRMDGKYFLYSLIPQVRMWRNTPESYFRNVKIHNGDIKGVNGPIFYSPYRIKHYGYIDISKVMEKFNLYSEIDAGGSRTYEHIRPETKTLTFKFIEFKNPFLNDIFVILNRIILDVVWYAARIFIKVRKKIKYA